MKMQQKAENTVTLQHACGCESVCYCSLLKVHRSLEECFFLNEQEHILSNS